MPGAGGARLLLAAGRRLRSVPAAVSPQKRAFYGLFGRGRDADNKAQPQINLSTSDPWVPAVCSKTGGTYYWNTRTNETTRVGAPDPSKQAPYAAPAQPQLANAPQAPQAPLAPLSEGEFAPVKWETQTRIDGSETQILSVDLQPGQGVRTEPGSLMYTTEHIEMRTHSAAGKGSMLSRFGTMLRRSLSGGTLFITDFVNPHPTMAGTVCLTTSFPAKLLRLKLADMGGSLTAQKGSFLASDATVNINIEFTRSIKAGFFGGEGFILQRLTDESMSGDGEVVLKAGGALVHRVLGVGEKLKVVPGALVCFSVNVQYDVSMLRGFANIFFGGESLFLVTLTGPGTVYLQSMSFDMLVMEINKRLPQRGSETQHVARGQTARRTESHTDTWPDTIDRKSDSVTGTIDGQTDTEPDTRDSQTDTETDSQTGTETDKETEWK